LLSILVPGSPARGAGEAPPAALPASQDGAPAVLETSPRHGEWVDVKMAEGTSAIRTWIVYPEREGRAPVVVVIHEIFGLTPWIRAVADQLAKDGFLAVAPDLLSGKGPGGGGTESAGGRDEVVALVRSLTPEEVKARLDAVRDHALGLPAAAAKSATIGFCWGGSSSFSYASMQPGLDAAVVYYGSSPDAARLAGVKAPVLGLYGADDARVTATIEPAAAEMKRLGRTYEVEIYPGAGHGFLREQEGREGANRRATEKAWPRTVEFLRTHLESR
jgi:carboxymethylenebutenolidase